MTPIMPIIRSQDPERLAARLARNAQLVDRGYEHGPCLEHTGARNNDGYGKMNFRCCGQHVQVYAHRVILTLKLGREIPSNMHPDHKCQNPACRHPDHIQMVTARRNVGELVQKRKAKKVTQ